MATIKPVLNPQINKDGTQTVRLRFTINRKLSYISLFKVVPRHYNETKNVLRKSSPNAEKLNNLLKSEVEEYSRRLEYLKKNKPNFTFQDITNPRLGSTTLFTYLDIRIERLMNNEQESTGVKYKQLKKSIQGFRDDPDLSEINVKWVEDFIYYLRSVPTIKSETTIMRKVKQLKTILNDAYKDNINVDNGARLFTVRMPKTIKDKLSIEELGLFKSFDNAKLNLTKDTFLLNYYLRGLRISDTLSLKKSNIVNGQFIIQEHKTNKKRAISINSHVLEIINRYDGESSYGYILPWVSKDPKTLSRYQFKRHLESKTTIINKQLKQIAGELNINKRITSHVARHTFATHGMIKGMNITQMQKLLGQESYRSTEIYIRSLVDENQLNELSSSIFE